MNKAEFNRAQYAHEAQQEATWKAQEEAAAIFRATQYHIQEFMDDITADQNRVLSASLYKEIMSMDYNVSAAELEEHADYIAAYVIEIEKREQEDWED